MNKKLSFILIIIVLVIGSFINFYGTNLLMSDLSNMFYGTHDAYIICSIPLFMICLDFVLAVIFLLRITRYPYYKKALIKLYSIFILVNSIIGAITSIISGIELYPSMLANYPFFCYPLIMLVVHILLAFGSIYVLSVLLKKIKDDKERRKLTWHYDLYSGVLGLLLYFAMYKFGSFIWMPIYVQTSTLGLSMWFYLWVLTPMGLVFHVIFYFYNMYKNLKTPIIYNSVVTLASFILGTVVLAIGYTQPELISAISPALPLERLASKPYDVILQYAGMLILGIYYIIYSLRSCNKAKK